MRSSWRSISGKGAHEQRLSFCHLPLFLIAIYEIFADEDRVRMMRTELLLADHERTPVQWFSLQVISLFVIEDSQIVEACSQVKMVRFEEMFADSQDTSQNGSASATFPCSR